METNEVKAKVTIIDERKGKDNSEQTTIPFKLSLSVIEMLVEDSIKAGLKIVIDPKEN